jgi:hypothetical protein
LAAAALGALALLLLGLALIHPLSHDEQQYVASAALAYDAQIYRDFIYLQTPYMPLLLGAAMEVVSDRPFLVARLFNWAVSAASVLLVYLLARRVAPRSYYEALGAAALFTSSSLAYYSFGTARNDLLPCFFALLGVYFFLCASGATGRRAAVQNFLCGAMLAAAVGSKITYAFAPLTLLLFSLARQWRAPVSGYARLELVPLVAGGLAGAIPMLVVALSSFANFWYGVVQYHATATIEWYSALGFESRLELPDRLLYFVRFFIRSDATLAASIWLATMLGAWVITPQRHRLSADRGIYLVPLLVAIVALPFALIPAPSWTQYFVPLVPFVILAPIFLGRLIPEADARRYAPVAAAAICLGSLPGLGNLAVDSLRALQSGESTPLEVQRIGAEIDAALGSRSGPIVTLAPIYVLEGRRPIPPEVASGVAFFRTGDLLDAETVVRLRGLSPRTLPTVLGESPPAGILVGVETDDAEYVDVEAPLRQYALDRGFEPIALDGPPAATLFLAPLTTRAE